jgi:hypothetical protein
MSKRIAGVYAQRMRWLLVYGASVWESVAWSAASIRTSAGASARTAPPATRATSGSAAAMRPSLTARRPATAAGSCPRATLLDRQRVALQFLAIHLLDGRSGLLFARHLDETKASGFARSPIPHDPDGRDLTEGLERLSDIILAGVSGEVSNIDVHLAFPLLRSEISEGIPVHTGSLRCHKKTVLMRMPVNALCIPEGEQQVNNYLEDSGFFDGYVGSAEVEGGQGDRVGKQAPTGFLTAETIHV